MFNQTLTKNQEIRQRIDKIEEEIQEMKWEIAPKALRRSVVDLSKGILGKKFEKGVEYQKKIRKEWLKRIKRLGL